MCPSLNFLSKSILHQNKEQEIYLRLQEKSFLDHSAEPIADISNVWKVRFLALADDRVLYSRASLSIFYYLGASSQKVLGNNWEEKMEVTQKRNIPSLGLFMKVFALSLEISED